jgi:hypothetical protein
MANEFDKESSLSRVNLSTTRSLALIHKLVPRLRPTLNGVQGPNV